MPVAVGDIHGRADLLDALLARFPGRDLVFLGDLTDRGPDSPGVVARVRALVDAGRATLCLGNHDLLLTNSVLDGDSTELWQMNGGTPDQWPSREALEANARWIRAAARPHHTEGEFLFSHAMRPAAHDLDAHIWGRPSDTPFYPLPEGLHFSVHGHTPFEGAPLHVPLPDGTTAYFIDTGAVWTGRLCGFDSETRTALVITLPAQATT